ncbi:MAG TPA: hypothetical protein VIV56_07240 [Gemmatimonadales bacterium]
MSEEGLRTWRNMGVVFGALTAMLTIMTVIGGMVSWATKRAVDSALQPVQEAIQHTAAQRAEGDSLIKGQISTLARAMRETDRGRKDLLLEQVERQNQHP